MANQLFGTTEIKEMVRARYGGIAEGSASSCCGTSKISDQAREMGYSADELAAAPEGAKSRPRLRQSASHRSHETRRSRY